MSDKKRLLTNFISLASVQGMNFILPLITALYLPYTIGLANVGIVNFAQIVMQYFIIFTDYGFNFIATKDIALAGDDKQKQSRIFSNVMAVKIILLLVSFLILLILVTGIRAFAEHRAVYLLMFGMVIGSVMFPSWFFQGIEQMKFISTLNVVSKSVFTVGIFIFIKQPSQYVYVPIFISLGYIVVGICALYLVFFRHNIRFYKVSFADMGQQLREGWDVFLSTFVTTFYTLSNPFVLKFFVSDTVLGYYTTADRIIKPMLAIIAPLIQTVFPFINRLIHESKERAMLMLNRIFIGVTILMGSLSVTVYFLAEPIGHMFPKYAGAVPFLKILAALPLIIGWANVFATLTMIGFDYKKQLSRIYVTASVCSVSLMAILIPIYKGYGAAWSTVLTEALATLLMVLFLRKKEIGVWKWYRKQ